ncbi:hypothetical protein J6G99_05785 [bacterium]|nr:hypothetical protein [bacterium]
MSLNVNYTSLYKNGIDTSMLKEVSQEILNRAAQKNSQYTQGVPASLQVKSVAKPVELGLDLYNGKLDTQVQKQIAINNSLQFQLNVETLKSIQFLNSQAAISSKIDGKYMPAVNAVVTESQQTAQTNKSQYMSIFVSESAKDKNGSNPFYNGELLMKNSEKKEEPEKDSLKSIFA